MILNIKKMKYLIFFCFLLVSSVWGKECTNIPTQLSSHTFRYELLSSRNESWREELYSFYHLIPTDDSAWSKLMPRKMLQQDPKEEFDWAMLYKSIKNPTKDEEISSERNFLREVSLHDVRLDSNSIHGMAQQTNLEYLLMLEVDNLVWNFRKTAGLPASGNPYGGWEDPKIELRGHFVGHYLSASAQMWAATGNKTLYEKMSTLVSALYACQKAIGTGYLSAFPSELFDRFEAIQPVWAPYYTIHKILAGLLDQYTLAKNTQALEMVLSMVEYFSNRIQTVISKYTIERHFTSLNEEVGGMNDVLYRLYTITGNEKHLVLAHLFDKPCFLGLIALQADNLSGFHANSHIPLVIGSQMRFEVTGDPLYKAIGTFFMEVVNSSHSYATGGTSVGEFWSDPKRLVDTLTTENEESCTTYNMLKVSRHLFRWTKEMAYADYYERALTNGVLSIQRGTDPGVMIYMLPLGPGVSKAKSYHGWGTKYDSFWCCYGTGVESFSKLGDSIYFEETSHVPGLYIIQFIASTLNWRLGGIAITQEVNTVTSWDPHVRISFKISAEKVIRPSTLNIRVPYWTHFNSSEATLNGQKMHIPSPGNFLAITRKWKSGDTLNLKLPITLRTENIKDDRPNYHSVQAILFGPYLLAGLSEGDWKINTGKASSLADWITAVPDTYNSQLISISRQSNKTGLVFSNSNGTITMEESPEPGTQAAIHATFRISLDDQNSFYFLNPSQIEGKYFFLEPFDLPGMVVTHGPNDSLIVSYLDKQATRFQIYAGLDGKLGTFSFESEKKPGCFIYSQVSSNASSSSVQLICKSSSSEIEDATFKKAVSFEVTRGVSEYHSMSFMTKGVGRNFLLMPLLSLRDEFYSVYFDIEE